MRAVLTNPRLRRPLCKDTSEAVTLNLRRERMRSAIVRFALMQICAVAVIAQTGGFQKHPYSGPACLAGFCLAKDPLPSEEELIKSYGEGTRIGEFHCYAVPEQKGYIHFGIEHDRPGEIATVFVSRAPNCVNDSGRAVNASKPLPALETNEGVRLGDSVEKVIELYGPPSAKRGGSDGLGSLIPYSRDRQGSPFGEMVLVYDGPPNQLIQAKFYLHRNKVVAIFLSCSE